MRNIASIPAFSLYGEDDPFPDVVHCEGFSARAPIYGWQILPHRHGQIAQLFFVTDGLTDASVDGAPYRLTNGAFLYVPEHCVHGFMFKPDTEGAVLSFPLALVRTIAPHNNDIVAALSKPIFGTMSARLAQLTHALRDVVNTPSPFRVQAVVGLAHSVLALLAEARLEQIDDDLRPVSARMLALDMLIVEHMGDNWSAADYANALSISTGHLSRVCRTATGVGAATYLEQKLMTEACRMLAFTLFPISEIGYRLGYSDPSYFSKRFRAVRRVTPTDYRAQFAS